MSDEFLLPHEVFDATGVPDDARDRVQAIILSAKYCALVEAVMKLTGGEPITVDLRRVRQIADQTQRTDPRDVVMVQEVALDDELNARERANYGREGLDEWPGERLDAGAGGAGSDLRRVHDVRSAPDRVENRGRGDRLAGVGDAHDEAGLLGGADEAPAVASAWHYQIRDLEGQVLDPLAACETCDELGEALRLVVEQRDVFDRSYERVLKEQRSAIRDRARTQEALVPLVVLLRNAQALKAECEDWEGQWEHVPSAIVQSSIDAERELVRWCYDHSLELAAIVGDRP